MFKTWLTVCFLLVSISGYSQFENKETGAKGSGLGGAYSSLGTSAWTIYANPAGLSSVLYREVGFFYTNAYGLKELQTISAVYAEPFQTFTLGGGIQQFGDEIYREMTASISFAHSPLNLPISVGYTANYHSLVIQNYGSASSWSVDAGIFYQPMEWMNIGISIFNLTQNTIGQSEEKLPVVWRTGTAIRLIQDIYLTTELYKQTGFSADWRTGFIYGIHENLTIFSGFGTEPSSLSAGFTLHYIGSDFDYSISNHPQLGLSHGISIGYNFGGQYSREQYFPELTETLYDPLFSKKPTTKETLSKKLAPKIVDINQATLEELEAIPGISKKLATEIIRQRERRGGLTIMDELMGIKGMGEKTFERVKVWLIIKPIE